MKADFLLFYLHLNNPKIMSSSFDLKKQSLALMSFGGLKKVICSSNNLENKKFIVINKFKTLRSLEKNLAWKFQKATCSKYDALEKKTRAEAGEIKKLLDLMNHRISSQSFKNNFLLNLKNLSPNPVVNQNLFSLENFISQQPHLVSQPHLDWVSVNNNHGQTRDDRFMNLTSWFKGEGTQGLSSTFVDSSLLMGNISPDQTLLSPKLASKDTLFGVKQKPLATKVAAAFALPSSLKNSFKDSVNLCKDTGLQGFLLSETSKNYLKDLKILISSPVTNSVPGNSFKDPEGSFKGVGTNPEGKVCKSFCKLTSVFNLNSGPLILPKVSKKRLTASNKYSGFMHSNAWAEKFYSASWLLESIISELSENKNSNIKRVLNQTFLSFDKQKDLEKKKRKDEVLNTSLLKGLRITLSGRMGGKKGMAKSLTKTSGRVPLSTLNEKVDFALGVVHTKTGCLGVKVWICYN